MHNGARRRGGGGPFDCKFRPEADLPKLAKGLSAATRERGLTAENLLPEAGRGERITNGIVMPQAVRPPSSPGLNGDTIVAISCQFY
jgi:hypothetical protein